MDQQWFSKTATDKFGRPLRTRGTLLKKGGSTRSSFTASLTGAQRRPSITGGRRNWQARWFSLDLDRGELRYFEDASMSVQKGLVLLTPETELQFDTPELRGKHAKESATDELHYFELTKTRDEKGALRDLPFQLRANSAAEHEQWCFSLQFSLSLVRETAGQLCVDDLDSANNKKNLVVNNKPAYAAELAQTLQKRGDTRDSGVVQFQQAQQQPVPCNIPINPPTDVPSPNTIADNSKKIFIPPPPSHPPPAETIQIPPPPPGPPPPNEPNQFIL